MNQYLSLSLYLFGKGAISLYASRSAKCAGVKGLASWGSDDSLESGLAFNKPSTVTKAVSSSLSFSKPG